MSSHNDMSPAADPDRAAEPEETPVRRRGRAPDDDRDRFWIDDFQSDHRSAVRPYVRTGGRSRPSHDLRLETLLSAAPAGRPPLVQGARRTPDLESIRDLCAAGPLSVAEISAHLSLALGVARVLISDAINAGMLLVHDSGHVADDGPSVELMTRVHRGLRRLA